MTERNIEEMSRDLKEIREAVRMNNPFFRDILENPAIWRFFFIWGVLLLALGLTWHYYLGAFLASRAEMTWWVKVLIPVFVIASGIVKWTSYTRIARKLDSSKGFVSVYMEMMTLPYMHAYIPLAIVIIGIIFGAVFNPVFAANRYFLSILCFLMGVVINFFGGAFRLKRFLIYGYWMLGWSVIAFFAGSQLPLPIGLGLSFGVGTMLLGIISMPGREEKGES